MREVAAEEGCPSYPPLVATAVYTGMRRGELCGLRWSDVDLERRMLVVRGPTTGRPRAGGAHGPDRVGAGAVPGRVEAGDRAAAPTGVPQRPGRPVGRRQDAHEEQRQRLRFAVAEACKRAKAAADPVPRPPARLRAHFVMNGGDLLTLQRILGHSTPTITGEVYSHLAPSHLVKESDRVSFVAPKSGGVALPRTGTGS